MLSSSIIAMPPGTGGVTDYANLMGAGLGAPVVVLAEDTPTDQWSGDLLILNFSGYGFQKRGVPTWLVQRMRELRPRFRQIGIMFHELFAFGPPWGSAFWLSGTQRRIARDLVMLADFWVTNREDSARWLGRFSHNVPHRALPVFSNVGEPANVDTKRSDRMVVFGSSGVRSHVYEWNDGEIFKSAKQHGLEIHDIGPPQPEGELARKLKNEGVVVRGRLPVEEVSAALLDARFGALVYAANEVAKSGVFAAYCAHGICPVLLARDYAPHDGLVPKRHYTTGFSALKSLGLRPEVIGKEARNWYEPHRVSAHQATFRALADEALRMKMMSSSMPAKAVEVRS